MNGTDSPAIRIGAWRVDAAREQISKDGTTVKLERRSMQLLLCLAGQPGQILSVEELLDRVWAGVVVTPDSVYHAIASPRRILGDDANEPTYITNIPRRGYSLVAPVAPWIDPLETAVDNLISWPCVDAYTAHHLTETLSVCLLTVVLGCLD
jgi:transcriptional activator of cad operon